MSQTWNTARQIAFRKALLDVYRSYSELKIFVDEALGKNLDEIVSPNEGLEIVAFQLVNWADAKKRLPDLLRYFADENPDYEFTKTLEQAKEFNSNQPLGSFLKDLDRVSKAPKISIEQEAACDMINTLVEKLITEEQEDYVVNSFLPSWNSELILKNQSTLSLEIGLKLLKNERINRSSLLFFLGRLQTSRFSTLMNVFLYVHCRESRFLLSALEKKLLEDYLGQEPSELQKIEILYYCKKIDCEHTNLEIKEIQHIASRLQFLCASNLPITWLTKIVILAGYCGDLRILESALDSLKRNGCDDDKRARKDRVLDSCCSEINKQFVLSILGTKAYLKSELRCPGYAHIIAKDARIISNSKHVLTSFEKMSQSWKEPLRSKDIQARLGQFSRTLLEKAGTPYFDWVRYN
ncbi:MAG: hypothetical protein EAZ61_01910 [Oscillatoriales cyanobacterium]|nr:MAG: hypothetical protein EAZ61_01910 [Oscillatoriales cyanobacterium]